MAVYAILSFCVFLYRTEKKRFPFYVVQIILMVVIQFLLFMQMMLKTDDMRYLFFFSFQAIVLIAAIIMHRMIYPDANLLIVNNMCLLIMISMAILTRLSGTSAIKQFIIVIASMIVALILPEAVRRLRILSEPWWIYAVIGILALGFVLILGRVVNGSSLNFQVMGVTFQPSEFVKIIFVFFAASALAKADNFAQIAGFSAIAALHILILVFSKDLGTALIFYTVFLMMLYVARERILYLVLGILAGGGAGIVAYRLFSHVRARVAAFIDPWSAIDGAGYQVTQSLFGISVGGPFGLGLYGGKPKAIPFVEQDFIFSAIAEELGIVFAVSVLLICLSTFFMMLWVAERTRNRFYRLLSAGFGVTYIFQVFLTVGGGVKFIPLTGVTLPLVSYGGTSVLSTILMFGVLQGGVLIRAQEHREAVERLTHREEPGYPDRSREEDYPEEADYPEDDAYRDDAYHRDSYEEREERRED
ncbi:MAG: FtsW/RodA/SpoVE family cell cycle protein [Lachnospiraceae bacterium]|nr:FtsW/RodA/SpoVE family cell cycle protein [Lachnospiraceae bacterium]